MSITNDEDVVLKRLIKSFFNNVLNFTLVAHEIEHLTWEKQQTFLDATVKNNKVKKYPVSSEFCRLFFKKLIGYLEPVQEIHDEFYTFLCSVLKNNKEDFCHRHYAIGDNFEDMIIMKETKNMVVNGTTGMKTWQAALMLADWIICNKEIFNGKKILELGSGVGFTGIAIAKNCHIPDFTFSDCHTDVIRTICDNININFPDLKQSYNDSGNIFQGENCKIGVMMLDWSCVDEVSSVVVPDIIIGADIIYDPTILQPLCNVIKTFFQRNNDLEVYIANIIRNEETYRSFLKLLDTMNLVCEQIIQSQPIFIEWDNTIERCLLKIKMTR